MIFRSRRPRIRPLALALQGGGAHGAFTWGVLDELLGRADLRITAVSGTSAGAVNAVLLAQGLARGGPAAARDALAAFWTDVGRAVPWDWLGIVAAGGDRLTPAGRLMLQWAQALGPLPASAAATDPLRELLSRHVDFDALRQPGAPAVHVAATQANSGRLRVFGNAALGVDAVLASACLPMMQPAVEIDGEPYWDGGYSANPALLPLVKSRAADDILVVMLSPWTLGETPRSAQEVRTRATEIAFNAAFLCEMRTLADALPLARRAVFPGPLERRLRATRWHLVDAHDTLAALPVDSKLVTHPQWLARLHDAGRAQAARWLAAHGGAIGREGTADLAAMFGSGG